MDEKIEENSGLMAENTKADKTALVDNVEILEESTENLPEKCEKIDNFQLADCENVAIDSEALNSAEDSFNCSISGISRYGRMRKPKFTADFISTDKSIALLCSSSVKFGKTTSPPKPVLESPDGKRKRGRPPSSKRTPTKGIPECGNVTPSEGNLKFKRSPLIRNFSAVKGLVLGKSPSYNGTNSPKKNIVLSSYLQKHEPPLNSPTIKIKATLPKDLPSDLENIPIDEDAVDDSSASMEQFYQVGPIKSDSDCVKMKAKVSIDSRINEDGSFEFKIIKEGESKKMEGKKADSKDSDLKKEGMTTPETKKGDLRTPEPKKADPRTSEPNKADLRTPDLKKAYSRTPEPIKADPSTPELKKADLRTADTKNEDSGVEDVIQKQMPMNNIAELPATPRLKTEPERNSGWNHGDVAWAKIGSYPYWPCVICPDSYMGVYAVEATFREKLQRQVHVQFVEDKGRHSWIRDGNLFKFNSKQQFFELKKSLHKVKDKLKLKNFQMSSKQKDAWELAATVAENIKTLPLEERLQFLKDIGFEFSSQSKAESKQSGIGSKRKRNGSDMGPGGKMIKMEDGVSVRPNKGKGVSDSKKIGGSVVKAKAMGKPVILRTYSKKDKYTVVPVVKKKTKKPGGSIEVVDTDKGGDPAGSVEAMMADGTVADENKDANDGTLDDENMDGAATGGSENSVTGGSKDGDDMAVESKDDEIAAKGISYNAVASGSGGWENHNEEKYQQSTNSSLEPDLSIFDFEEDYPETPNSGIGESAGVGFGKCTKLLEGKKEPSPWQALKKTLDRGKVLKGRKRDEKGKMLKRGRGRPRKTVAELVEAVESSDEEVVEELQRGRFESGELVEDKKVAAVKKKFNLFSGLKFEKVCNVCEKPGSTYKCKGPCLGFYHLQCAEMKPGWTAVPTQTVSIAKNDKRGRPKKVRPMVVALEGIKRGRGRPKKTIDNGEEGGENGLGSGTSQDDLETSRDDLETSRDDLETSKDELDMDTSQNASDSELSKQDSELEALRNDLESMEDCVDWSQNDSELCDNATTESSQNGQESEESFESSQGNLELSRESSGDVYESPSEIFEPEEKILEDVKLSGIIVTTNLIEINGSLSDRVRSLEDIPIKEEEDEEDDNHAFTEEINGEVMEEAIKKEQVEVVGDELEVVGDEVEAIGDEVEAVRNQEEAIGDEAEAIRDEGENEEESTGKISAEEDGKKGDFTCKNCAIGSIPACFACGLDKHSISGSKERIRCYVGTCGHVYHKECLKEWPQATWSNACNKAPESVLMCPQHYCHICISDNPGGIKTRLGKERLVRCIRCPTSYHMSNFCIPAGSEILTMSQIICPRHFQVSMSHKPKPNAKTMHVNVTWCFICSTGGSLICCDSCPAAFHPECACLSDEDQEGSYICEDCKSGRYPLYGEVVWAKMGHFRWWPAQILFPIQIPMNIRSLPRKRGDFAVKFFGSNDYNWINRGRVFLYQEGDTGNTTNGKSPTDKIFEQATLEAELAHIDFCMEKVARDEDAKIGMKPPKYTKIKTNKPVGNVRVMEINLSNISVCECDPASERPCAPDTDCLNRMLMIECNPEVCNARERCNNQYFEKRIYPMLAPYKTDNRGWGLRALEDLRKGQFIIEYVGEMIDEEEYRIRMARMREKKDENYYFLTVDTNRMIDAGPKGNVARFINHSCDPNCETQKWTVNGDTRIGIFAKKDIAAMEELVFNYNLASDGDMKRRCQCGSRKCSGFIGGKIINTKNYVNSEPLLPAVKYEKPVEKGVKPVEKTCKSSEKASKAKVPGKNDAKPVNKANGSSKKVVIEREGSNRESVKYKAVKLAQKIANAQKARDSECFVCHKEGIMNDDGSELEGGSLIFCQNKYCPKAYHPPCVARTRKPHYRWLCPWHYCTTCRSRKKVSKCTLCVNSYCEEHLDLLPFVKGIGLVCLEHKKGTSFVVKIKEGRPDPKLKMKLAMAKARELRKLARLTHGSKNGDAGGNAIVKEENTEEMDEREHYVEQIDEEEDDDQEENYEEVDEGYELKHDPNDEEAALENGVDGSGVMDWSVAEELPEAVGMNRVESIHDEAVYGEGGDFISL